MRPGRLYVKILLSFILVLFVAEILIFALFVASAGREFHARFKQYTRAKVLIARELIEERIHARTQTLLADNEALRESISHVGEIFEAKVWLADSAGKILEKSFEGEVPSEVINIGKRHAIGTGPYEMHRVFKRHRAVYSSAPVKIGYGEVGRLHILFQNVEPSHAKKGLFALGLLVIGLIIGLLVIPISRFITKPIKRLNDSALRIAEGDLSQRVNVKSKDEIGELGLSFNRMADKLERMIRGGRELTANVSHELRSPLARIRVAEELLREKLERGELDGWNRHLNDMREDIEVLDHLIGRILTLSKLDIHEKPPHTSRIDLRSMLEELLSKHESAAEKKALNIGARLGDGLYVCGNPDALQSALSNIIDNAIKFSPEMGNVRLEANAEQRTVKIRVTNTSEALPEDDLVRIFEPFYRTESSRQPGCGLGLAIAKRAVEKHGGNIEAAYSPEGFCVVVCLPTASPESVQGSGP